MATFLTTSKMDPALAARIEASVRGRDRKAGRSTLAPRLVAVVRFAVVVGVVVGICSFVLARRRDKREIDGTIRDFGGHVALLLAPAIAVGTAQVAVVG